MQNVDNIGLKRGYLELFSYNKNYDKIYQDEKKELDSLCRSVTIGWDGHRRTVWGEILHGLERILGRSPIYYKQPDYSKLVYMSTSSGRKNQKDPNIRVY